jgi:LPXTG-site transpeptidase (sortase) family protein
VIQYPIILNKGTMIFSGKKFRPYQYLKENPRLRVLREKLKVFDKIALLSFFVGLVLLLFLFSPFILGESIKILQKAQSKVDIWAKNEKDTFEGVSFGDLIVELESTPIPTPNIAKLPFSIKIDKIGLESKVISNVDANNSEIYKSALKKGVAHGLGSAFPGQGKMIYIFGHSTDYIWNIESYNALFYQVKDLEAGDEIVLNLGENEYNYVVNHKEIIENSDVDFANDKSDENILILQTCYPPGTTWKRLMVIAEPVNGEIKEIEDTEETEQVESRGFGDLI